jgi:hypothetical protein
MWLYVQGVCLVLTQPPSRQGDGIIRQCGEIILEEIVSVVLTGSPVSPRTRYVNGDKESGH